MEALLRWYVGWRGRSTGARVILYDGAAEVEKTRSFVRGALTGIAFSFGIVALAAPGSADSALLAEASRRAALVHEAEARAQQAAHITDACLVTAQRLDQTLADYKRALGDAGRLPGQRMLR
ncbi:MAG TPA: hypothetical protein VFH27_17950 [Longimicrobiaceae bacterium]|nr:hypothetical protein [Longimicrobiaceae bacterium]